MSKKIYSIKGFLYGLGLLLLITGLWSFSYERGKTQGPTDKPEENRFTKVVLAEKLDEPMEFTVLQDGRVLLIERKGAVKIYYPQTNEIRVIATIPVSTKYTSKEGRVTEAEDGLLGVVQDPKFEQNHWIYLYYSEPGNEAKNILARYELRGEELVMSSKKVLLEIPVQREQCCHTGGGMVFDAKGNLYLSTGDNTSPRATAYNPIDERPERFPWDAQKSSGNTNDLRGKIIRIHPEADGSYTIPEGNLFPKGRAKTRPEIYTMGHRNPWRLSIDSKTGFLYWGEVGPDAGQDSVGRGPRGHDEFNQARRAGNFGWPYFIGDNKAYHPYNFATGQTQEAFDPAKPLNRSPNNTGLTELPPVEKAFIWYPYGTSTEFPLVGSGGRSATGGPIYRKADFKNAKRAFPDYYEGKWFIVEFMRGWIMAVTIDERGNYVSMEPFIPTEKFGSAIDMKFGPDGDLYVLEYGSAWFRGNDNARLVRIEYNAGNRKPLVQITADKKAGALPLTVRFSSEGTKDYDKDALKYEWKISSKNTPPQIFTQANPTVTFEKPGVYEAMLTVTDAKGEKSSKTLQIRAGNEPPVVAFDITKGNQTFFFPDQTIEYAVKVSDKEDGSLENGKILPAQVAVSIDYMPEGFDQVTVAMGHRSADDNAEVATGLKLMDASDCKACHTMDQKSVGPSFKQISQKYKNEAGATDKLAKKVIEGGGGVWGEVSMSAHPQLSLADATQMVKYILNLSEEKAVVQSLPVKGSYTTKVPEGESSKGSYVLRAAYSDKGTKAIPSLSTEQVKVLRNPVVLPETADHSKGTQLMTTPSKSFYLVGNDAYLGFSKIDLTGINGIEFLAQASTRVDAAGGTIEIYLDSPTGKLLGKTSEITVEAPTPMGGAQGGAPNSAASTPSNSTNKQGSASNTQANSNAAPASTTTGGPGVNPATPSGTANMAAMMRRRFKTLKADIVPTTGVHDVYFIFKNSKAAPNQILMQVAEIQFGSNNVSGAISTPENK